MRFLFDGKYAPLTDTMVFIDAPIDDVLRAFYLRIEAITLPGHKKRKTETYIGSFEGLLLKSLPFEYPWKDILFETKSKWTGFFQNFRQTEIYHGALIAYYAKVEAIGAVAWLSDYGRVVNGWGGGAFHFLRNKEFVRTLMLSEQDRWEFDNYGKPFPFEDVEKYKEKFSRNRFTPEMLDKYLKEFSIDFFNEDFYMPTGSKAYIVEQIRPPFNEGDKPVSLVEMRKKCGYE